MKLGETKLQVAKRVDALEEDLWRIASSLYANPELSFNEFQSVDLITNFLGESGFDIVKGSGGLETAFQAVRCENGDSPVIAILAASSMADLPFSDIHTSRNSTVCPAISLVTVCKYG